MISEFFFFFFCYEMRRKGGDPANSDNVVWRRAVSSIAVYSSQFASTDERNTWLNNTDESHRSFSFDVLALNSSRTIRSLVRVCKETSDRFAGANLFDRLVYDTCQSSLEICNIIYIFHLFFQSFVYHFSVYLSLAIEATFYYLSFVNIIQNCISFVKNSVYFTFYNCI